MPLALTFATFGPPPPTSPGYALEGDTTVGREGGKERRKRSDRDRGTVVSHNVYCEINSIRPK